MAVVRVDMGKRSKFQGGAAVPDGTYTCELMTVADAESSQKKSPQLNVQLEIADGSFQGSRITDFIPNTEASGWRVADFAYALGVDDPEEVDINFDDFCRLNEEGEEIQEQGAVVQVKKVTEMQQDKDSGQERKRIRIFYNRMETEEEAPAEKKAAAAPKPPLKKPLIKGSKLRVKA